MSAGIIWRQSLKTRIILTVLAVLALGMGGMAVYVVQSLRSDMARALGAQQLSTVSIVAADIDHEMADRLAGLAQAAAAASAAMQAGPAAMQTFVEQRLELQYLFNGGVIGYQLDGTAIADFPPATGRRGVNYLDIDVVAAALKQGRATIGRPLLGKKLQQPVFGMAAPIRDAQGQVIGALAGVINLGQSNFLDKITQNAYGQSGSYLLVAPQYRLIVTGSDKRRVMEVLPARGVNPKLDRFIDGYRGAEVLVNPLGVEVLVAAQSVPSAGWYLAAVIPVAEALAPALELQRHIVLASLAVFFLIAGLIGWIVRQQLAPTLAAAQALAAMTDNNQPLRPLLLARQDEVGYLIAGFNRLLATLQERSARLQDSERALRESQRIARLGGWTLELASRRLSWTEETFRIHALAPGEPPPLAQTLDYFLPDARALIEPALQAAIGSGTPFDLELQLQTATGQLRWVQVRGEARQAAGEPGVISGTFQDITERKQIEVALLESERRYRNLVENTDDLITRVDVAGRFTFVNQAALSIFGLTAAQCLGQSAFDFIHPQDRDATQRAFAEWLNNQVHTLQFENRQVSRQGETHWMQWNIVADRAESGEIIGFSSIARDLTQMLRSEEALRASHQTLRGILETTLDGYWRLDAQGRLLDVNPAYVQQSGYSREELLKLSVFDLEAQESAATTSAHRQHIIDQGKDLFESCHRRRDGSLWQVEVSVTYNPEAAQFVVFLRDISERKSSERELDQYRHHLEELVALRTTELADAKSEAEAANIAKSAFLANMSHEIRTPMNGILGIANILRREGVTAQQAKRLDTIDFAAQHLLAVLNDILDLSKIEAGKFILEESAVAVNALLANVVSILAERASAKGLQLLIEADSFALDVLGDPTRLQQALLNYAANAVKFTEHGQVTLRALRQDETADALTVRFEVQDTGVGIAPDTLARLFNAFEQADNSMTRKHGGTGLGLAITRRLAEMMGGQAGAHSVPGGGSTFWFSVRLKKAHRSALAPTPAAGEAEHLLRTEHAGLRVLVVDDEPINREIAQLQLELVGWVVDSAEDGAQAVALASQTRYALILMDMQMPTLNGLEATRQIRRLPHGRATPIVAMTANAFAEDKARCLAAGMSDFLTKPFELDTLFETLLRALRRDAPEPGVGADGAT